MLVVAAALVDDLNQPTRLLAAQRSKPKSLQGRWEFPGGKVDPGETPTQALHRELREELGVEIHLGNELVGPSAGVWELTDQYVMRLWFAQVRAGEPQALTEHSQLRWLEAGAWLSVPWLDPDLPIVREIERVARPNQKA